MVEKIRAYIDHEFSDIQQTQKVIELKEEIISNLIEKYQEQLAQGKSEADAYNAVITSIGDLSELIDSVRVQPLAQPSTKERARRALFTAGAIALYIISPFVFMLIGDGKWSLFIMFACIALATGMLVYNHMTKPLYVKAEDTIVEDFKEWRTKSGHQQDALKSFRSAYWSLVTAAYLLVSFVFGIWAFSWILFIVAAAAEQIVKGIISLKDD